MHVVHVETVKNRNARQYNIIEFDLSNIYILKLYYK